MTDEQYITRVSDLTGWIMKLIQEQAGPQGPSEDECVALMEAALTAAGIIVGGLCTGAANQIEAIRSGVEVAAKTVQEEADNYIQFLFESGKIGPSAGAVVQ